MIHSCELKTTTTSYLRPRVSSCTKHQESPTACFQSSWTSAFNASAPGIRAPFVTPPLHKESCAVLSIVRRNRWPLPTQANLFSTVRVIPTNRRLHCSSMCHTFPRELHDLHTHCVVTFTPNVLSSIPQYCRCSTFRWGRPRSPSLRRLPPGPF